MVKSVNFILSRSASRPLSPPSQRRPSLPSSSSFRGARAPPAALARTAGLGALSRPPRTVAGLWSTQYSVMAPLYSRTTWSRRGIDEMVCRSTRSRWAFSHRTASFPRDRRTSLLTVSGSGRSHAALKPKVQCAVTALPSGTEWGGVTTGDAAQCRPKVPRTRDKIIVDSTLKRTARVRSHVSGGGSFFVGGGRGGQ